MQWLCQHNQKELMSLGGVKEVAVDVEKDAINVTYDTIERVDIANKLHSLGYPEATEKNGLLLQLKSYGSCMVGKISNL
jgi:hypothetical protein